MKMQEKARKKRMLLLILIVIAIAFFSFCVQSYRYGMQSPADVVRGIVMWIRLSFARAFHTSAWLHYQEITGAFPLYGSVVTRIKMTAIVFICGMMMALSGTIFQTVFRNPMAAPTMLGVSTGVSTGILILVVQYGTAALSMMTQKYIYCYLGAFIILGLVLLIGKLSSGRKRMSVFDLLIVGTIISAIIGAVASYYSISMENDVALVYTRISGALTMDTTNTAFIFLGVAACISIIPMILLRFSFNAVSFDNDDTRSLGVNAYAMKIVTLVLGTVMITAAMVHCGTAGMISLIAPFIGRGLYGADFRKNFVPTMLIGGGLLMLCKAVVGLIPFGDEGLPLGTVVDFVMLPFFVLILAKTTKSHAIWVE